MTRARRSSASKFPPDTVSGSWSPRFHTRVRRRRAPPPISVCLFLFVFFCLSFSPSPARRRPVAAKLTPELGQRRRDPKK